jgi:hypothetical protein
MENLEVRINNVMKGLRKAGFVARRNVMSCCRGCVNLEAKEGQPAFWSFGGQGHAVSVKGDEAYFNSNDKWSYHKKDLMVYFNHEGILNEDGELNENGKALVSLLEDNGIVYEWDGSRHRCIVVNMDASSAFGHKRAKEAAEGYMNSMVFV